MIGYRDEDMTEKEWQRQVVELARTLGWTAIYHTHDSRRSAHGFPDLVLARDRVVFIELKTARGKLSEPQKHWLNALRAAGAEAYVCRPSQLQTLAAILARPTPDSPLAAATAAETATVTP